MARSLTTAKDPNDNDYIGKQGSNIDNYFDLQGLIDKQASKAFSPTCTVFCERSWARPSPHELSQNLLLFVFW